MVLKKLMKFMMISQMMSGKSEGGMSAMLPYMMLGGNGGLDDMFSGMLDMNEPDDEEDEIEEEEE